MSSECNRGTVRQGSRAIEQGARVSVTTEASVLALGVAFTAAGYLVSSPLLLPFLRAEGPPPKQHRMAMAGTESKFIESLTSLPSGSPEGPVPAGRWRLWFSVLCARGEAGPVAGCIDTGPPTRSGLVLGTQ